MPSDPPIGRPSVAVVVPNYNHAAYLPMSLASIAAQTMPPDEVLIIDDASTDGSLDIIAEFIEQHPSWKIVRHTERLGVVRGQNEALQLLKTDWISFLGADDLMHRTFLEKAITAAATLTPVSNLICGCVKLVGTSGGDKLRPILLPAVKFGYISADEFGRLLKVGDNYFVGTAVVYRRAALSDLGGLDPLLGSLADGVLGRQLAIRGGFYFIPQVLGYWRLHGTNYSQAMVTRAHEINPLLERMRLTITSEKVGRFPPGYEQTLDRRVRYGGARLLALDHDLPALVRAERIAEICRSPTWERKLLTAAMSIGHLGTMTALTWLTLRADPMSILQYLRQWQVRRAILAAVQS